MKPVYTPPRERINWLWLIAESLILSALFGVLLNAWVG